MLPGKPSLLARQIGVQIFAHAIQMAEECLVFGRRLQTRLVDFSQHRHGIVSCRDPEIAIQTPKKLDGLVIPSPSQVVRQLAQRLETWRQLGDDGECSNWLHAFFLDRSFTKAHRSA
jgi:hypothetical protein